MSTVADIENALRSIPLQDARAVSDWPQEYLEDQWNHQIAHDAESGKLDKIAAQALAHYKAGRTKPLT